MCHGPILTITFRPSERVPLPVPAGGCLLLSENTNRDVSCPQTIVPSPCEKVRLTLVVPWHSTIGLSANNSAPCNAVDESRPGKGERPINSLTGHWCGDGERICCVGVANNVRETIGKQNCRQDSSGHSAGSAVPQGSPRTIAIRYHYADSCFAPTAVIAEEMILRLFLAGSCQSAISSHSANS